jgi:hypothetical protein
VFSVTDKTGSLGIAEMSVPTRANTVIISSGRLAGPSIRIPAAGRVFWCPADVKIGNGAHVVGGKFTDPWGGALEEFF